MADKTSKQDKQRPWQDEMGKGTSLLMVVTTVVKNVKRKSSGSRKRSAGRRVVQLGGSPQQMWSDFLASPPAA
jgi:hypothetical protein